MRPYEIYNPITNRSEFSFYLWDVYRFELFESYQVQPNHDRFEFVLEEYNGYFDMQNAVVVKHMSSIFEPANVNIRNNVIVFAEENHIDPWGDQVLMIDNNFLFFKSTFYKIKSYFLYQSHAANSYRVSYFSNSINLSFSLDPLEFEEQQPLGHNWRLQGF